jgi:hypothetical protein
MRLYNSSGTEIAANDDSAEEDGAGGSFAIDDSFLQLFLNSGMYFVGISQFPTVPLVAGQSYALQVSVDGHAIPEPRPLLLIVLAVAILLTLNARARHEDRCGDPAPSVGRAQLPTLGPSAATVPKPNSSVCTPARSLGRAAGHAVAMSSTTLSRSPAAVLTRQATCNGRQLPRARPRIAGS